ncbi:cytochrome domain of cellobiose dehydrogenase Hp3 Ph 7.5 [Phellopilus nigrolimitatus]|nr:cytochrome domain of cellobiose dehydrogenase Hp3 Ph 7.5 [Phellopilus nigrolimitatus]
MSTFRPLLVLAAAATAALAQSSSYTDSGITFQGITDSTYNITVGFVMPPAGSAGTDEFIGEIISPTSINWVGVALGGKMANDLLLVAWPNGEDIVASTRFATGHVQPTAYAGPTLTTLSQTSVDADTWRWVFRCQNCTSWAGDDTSGSLNTTSVGTVAWAISSEAVDDPSDPESDFHKHNDTGTWAEDFAGASSSSYSSYIG